CLADIRYAALLSSEQENRPWSLCTPIQFSALPHVCDSRRVRSSDGGGSGSGRLREAANRWGLPNWHEAARR
ncbi:MAG: hypothetical protein SNJ82_14085, partial [Gemmataceae bacterium]